MFLVYYIAYDRSLGAQEGGPYTPLSFGLHRKYFCLTVSVKISARAKLLHSKIHWDLAFPKQCTGHKEGKRLHVSH